MISRAATVPLLFLGVTLTPAQDVQLDPAGNLGQWRAMADSGRTAEAEAAVRAYMAKHRDSAEVHFLLGYVLFRQRRARESLAEYTEGAKLHEPGARDLQTVASDYVLLEDYPDADKWFSKALQWDPDNLLLLYFLGRTKYKENRFDEAVALFERCIQADAHNVKGWDNLGLSQQGLGRMEDAEKSFRTAVKLQDDGERADAGPYLNLGSLLVDTDRAEESVPLLKEALRINGREIRAHRELGKAYLHLNRLDEAQAELEESVREAPEQAATHSVLAQLYRRRGMAEKARQEVQAYSRLAGSTSMSADDPK